METLPAEDTIHYQLYPADTDSLQQLLSNVEGVVSELAHQYMWYYEPFQLAAVTEWRGDTPPHLAGSVCYRECVDDEWMVVHILFSLTERYRDLVISMCDSDGQLLLIEAAEYIPRWLTPDTSLNRVFIYCGDVHIIPKPVSPGDITTLPAGTPSLSHALQLVRGVVNTVAGEGVQQSVKKRIKRSLSQVLLHRAHCWLPCPVAHLINHTPQLVSAAVHALCDRDSEDTMACRQMTHFRPDHHQFVMCEVMFTRLLYAKLLHQKFTSPWGRGHTLPPSSSPLHTPHTVGMKLVCGMEILASRYGGGQGGGGEGVCDGPQWSKFLQSLTEKGYFMGEIEGSLLYQQLMQSARDYYSRQFVHREKQEHGGGGSILERSGLQLLSLLKARPCTQDAIDSLQSRPLAPPDDDSWLELTPQSLDEMMNNSLAGENDSGLDLENAAFAVKSFVDKTSSHAGAELPWSSSSDMAGVSFNPDQFVAALDTMLKKLVEVEEQGEEDSMSSGSDEGSVSDEGEQVEEMVELLQLMDTELSHTEVGKTFHQQQQYPPPADSNELGTATEPVNVDLNLVESLVQSYSSQLAGETGPASNLLHSMGLQLPATAQQLMTAAGQEDESYRRSYIPAADEHKTML